MQRFTPRGPRSKWSQINRDKAEGLIEAGRMRPAGQAQVDAAKADGRWAAAYAGQKSATVPDDLAAVLAADPQAKAFFETLREVDRRHGDLDPHLPRGGRRQWNVLDAEHLGGPVPVVDDRLHARHRRAMHPAIAAM